MKVTLTKIKVGGWAAETVTEIFENVKYVDDIQTDREFIAVKTYDDQFHYIRKNEIRRIDIEKEQSENKLVED